MYFRITAPQETAKPKSALIPEKVAIISCGLLISVVAIPVLVVIQALSAVFTGTTTVFELLNGQELFDDREDVEEMSM